MALLSQMELDSFCHPPESLAPESRAGPEWPAHFHSSGWPFPEAKSADCLAAANVHLVKVPFLSASAAVQQEFFWKIQSSLLS